MTQRNDDPRSNLVEGRIDYEIYARLDSDPSDLFETHIDGDGVVVLDDQSIGIEIVLT